MADWQVDGQPFENPIDAADEGYAATPPSYGAWLSGLAGSLSLSSMDSDYSVSRFVATSEYGGTQGQDDFSSKVGRALAVAGESGGGMVALPLDLQAKLPGMDVTPAPMESPESYNARAPIGPDGQRVHIGDQPMPQPVADMVISALTAKIERDGVIARGAAAHAWPVRLATESAAFMMDPMNAATAFVPGIGEEAALEAVGRVGLTGFAGRTAARLGAGFTAGAAQQVPVAALRYGVSQQEVADYTVRDAMKDMVFGGVGNAIFHAGLGTAFGEIGRKAPVEGETAPTATAHLYPESIIEAPAAVKDAAMRGAVSQIVDGRPVDVAPAFGDPRQLPDVAAEQRALYANGYASGIPQADFDSVNDETYGTPTMGARSVPREAPPEQIDSDLAAAEIQYAAHAKANGIPLEEDGELKATADNLNAANLKEQAYNQAAECLAAAEF